MSEEIKKMKYNINGMVLSYLQIHRRIARENGKACKCSNPQCTFKNPKRFHWALIKGRSYSLDVNDYMQLCASCHKKYDMTEEIRLKIKKWYTHKYGSLNHASKKVIDTSNNNIYPTIKDAAKIAGVSPVMLGRMLMGINRNKTNFKYYAAN